MTRHSPRRGAALLVSLITLMVVMLLTGAVLQSLLAARRQMQRSETQLQAEWLAEAAVSRAITRLATQPEYTGETWRVVIGESDQKELVGVAQIRVENDAAPADRKRIIAIARYPDDPIRQVTARRDYTIRTN